MCILPLLPEPVICQSLGYIYILFTVLASTKAVYHYPHILLKKKLFHDKSSCKRNNGVMLPQVSRNKFILTHAFKTVWINLVHPIFLLQIGKILWPKQRFIDFTYISLEINVLTITLKSFMLRRFSVSTAETITLYIKPCRIFNLQLFW